MTTRNFETQKSMENNDGTKRAAEGLKAKITKNLL